MDKCSHCYIVDRAKLAYCPDCKKVKKTLKDAPTVDVLNKIREEIRGKYRVVLKSTPKDDWAVKWNDCIDEVLQIIDKYKTERSE